MIENDTMVPGTGAANPPLLVKRLSPTATLPTRGSENAAGWDLYYDKGDPDAYYEVELSVDAPRNKGTFSTGIAVKIPKGFYGRIAPRSGLAANGIDVLGGVIDSDYRGEVKVVIINHGWHKHRVEHGDRIAQLIIERISLGPIIEVDELDSTARGEGGFGSTGR